MPRNYRRIVEELQKNCQWITKELSRSYRINAEELQKKYRVFLRNNFRETIALIGRELRKLSQNCQGITRISGKLRKLPKNYKRITEKLQNNCLGITKELPMNNRRIVEKLQKNCRGITYKNAEELHIKMPMNCRVSLENGKIIMERYRDRWGKYIEGYNVKNKSNKTIL